MKAIIDLETTGLSALTDRILAIGIIKDSQEVVFADKDEKIDPSAKREVIETLRSEAY